MKKIILVLSLLLGMKIMQAQTTDVELWSGGALDVKLHKRFSASLEQVFKFNDTISHFKSAYTELGGKFKINRMFSFGFNYRYIENPPAKNAHRFSGDFIFNLGKKGFPLSFQYRLRYQREKGVNNNNAEDYVRNKFKLDYNLSKLVDPYISLEPFFRFNGKNEFRVMRYEIGLEWRIIKNLQLTSFYRLQKDVNVKRPDKTHVIGLMLSYEIRTYEKKSKGTPIL